MFGMICDALKQVVEARYGQEGTKIRDAAIRDECLLSTRTNDVSTTFQIDDHIRVLLDAVAIDPAVQNFVDEVVKVIDSQLDRFDKFAAGIGERIKEFRIGLNMTRDSPYAVDYIVQFMCEPRRIGFSEPNIEPAFQGLFDALQGVVAAMLFADHVAFPELGFAAEFIRTVPRCGHEFP